MTPPEWMPASWARALPKGAQRNRRLARIGVLVGVIAAFAFLTGLFGGRLHAMRELRATGPGWSFPSRLYSADLPLTPGDGTPPDALLRQLEARGYQRVARSPAAPGEFVTGDGTFEIGLRGFDAAPDPAGHGGPERVRVTYAHGQLFAVERLGGYSGRPAPDLAHDPRLEPILFSMVLDTLRVRRTWVPLARIPKIMQEAVIASEDRRFRWHWGLDMRSNARALFVNVRAGGVRQGGSTLTQQLARALFLGRERTLPRKLAEAVLAVALEFALSKNQILEMYLNSVYWGQDGGDGIAGIAEASRHYFGVPPDSLKLAQAAMLAGIIPGPNVLSPFRSPHLALRSRHRVLGDLVEVGIIDSATAGRADRSPLGLHHVDPPPERFPAASGFVRDELARRLENGAAEHLGLAVFTTIDPVQQAEAETQLVLGLNELEPPRAHDPLQGAFVALDPVNAAVKALVGGRDSQPGDFNRATQARRQAGSAMKPVVYAAALDPTRGEPPFTPASTVPDLRHAFGEPGDTWTPRNDMEEYHATVTLAKALAKSLNVATSNLVHEIGPNTIVRYAERFGLGRLKPVASIGLGSNEVTPLAMTAAYTVFANRGMRAEPTAVRATVNAHGGDPLPRLGAPTRVIPPETAALMTGMLQDVVAFGVAYPLRKSYGFMRPAAGKTGTTNDFKDAWFVGFTPQLVAGVWVGHDQPRPLGGPAAETALRVWARLMSHLLEGLPSPDFDSDRSLQTAWIDPYSGGLARRDCPTPMLVAFLPGTAPRKTCTRDHTADWRRIWATAGADTAATSGTESETTKPQEADTTATQPEAPPSDSTLIGP